MSIESVLNDHANQLKQKKKLSMKNLLKASCFQRDDIESFKILLHNFANR